MKKNVLALFTAVALAFCIALTGCGDQKTSDTTDATATEETSTEATTTEAADSGERTETTADGVLYSEDGIDVREVEVNLVGSTFNFSVVFANNNDVEKDFDCSKFTIVKDDETIQPTTQTKTLDANESYMQWAFPIREPGSLALGDEVDVYYGETLITTVTVEEF